jgi:hypothetical protein
MFFSFRKSIPSLLIFISFINFVPFLSFADQHIFLSEKPGTYRQDVVLKVKKVVGGDRLFYCFIDNTDKTGPWIPFNDQLILSSIEGEEREYRMDFRLYSVDTLVDEFKLICTIDKKKPLPPVPAVMSGEYKDDVILSFMTREQETIVYAVNKIVLESGVVWDKKDIRLRGGKGKKTRYSIQAYSLDNAGNRSTIITCQYIINKKQEALEGAVIDVKSPVAGTFSNKQLLFITSENVRWIKYTIDGSNPVSGGTLYTEPVTIDATGNVTVQIAVMPRWEDAAPVVRKISYTIVPEEKNPITTDKVEGVFFEDIIVTLFSSERAQYLYTLEEKSPSKKDNISGGNVALKGIAGTSTFVPLRVRRANTDNSPGGEYRFFFCINRERAAVKQIRVKGEEPLSTPVYVEIVSVGEGTIYYTLDGTIPDRDALPYTGEFVLTPRLAYPDNFVLISAVSFDRFGIRGDVIRRKVLFKIEKPPRPEIKILYQTKKGDRIKLGFDEDKIIIFEVTSDDSQPPVPTRDSQKVSMDIDLEVPEGMEKKFKFAFCTFDTEMFRLSDPAYCEYLLDRKPPHNPDINGMPSGKYSQKPVVVFINKDRDSKIYYKLTDDGSEPMLRGSEGIPYTGAIELGAKEQGEIIYRIKACAIDALGNSSFSLNEYYCKVDMKPPDPPPAPSITPSGKDVEQVYNISWDKPDDEDIFFRMYSIGEAAGPFVVYQSPIIYDPSRYPEGIMIDSYYKDYAGNVGEPFSFRLRGRLKGKLESPYVVGVTDGGHYNRKVRFELKAASGSIRYELTDDGTKPPGVRITSPVWAGPMSLDVAEGTSHRYAIRARVIDDDVCDLEKGELVLNFSVDKEPPAAPSITGIVNKGYYYESRAIQFAAEDALVYYNIKPEYEDTAKKYPENFSIFSEEVVLDVPNGRTELFTISAFSMDRAGNLSKEVPQWRIYIDKNSIYVSPNGNDAYVGTQERPLRTLNAAIDYSAATGRSDIILACGIYQLIKYVDIVRDMTIRGGLDPVTWEKCSSVQFTIIDTVKHFTPGKPLLNVSGGSLTLRTCELRDSYGLCPALIGIENGSLSIARTTFRLERKGWGSCIAARGGTIEIDDSYFTGKKSEYGFFIDGKGVKLVIRGSEFIGPDNGYDFTCLKLLNSYESMISNTSFFPGDGGITRGIECEGSTITFLNSQIDTGSGNRNAIGMSIKDSLVHLSESIVNGNRAARYIIGITSENSALTLEQSIVNVNARRGAKGIRVRGGSIDIIRSNIKSSPTEDFLYMFDCEQEKGRYFNNLIVCASSADTVCVMMNSSDSLWIHNTIIVGTGDINTSGFIFKGAYSSSLINNIIARDGNPSGCALQFIGETNVTTFISNNNLAGWEKMLKIDYLGPQTTTYSSLTSQSIVRSDIDGLNAYDGDSLAGYIQYNISEPFRDTFDRTVKELYHLSPTSRCIDAGFNVGSFTFEELKTDIDGQVRPDAGKGKRPLYDIGADEYHRD